MTSIVLRPYQKKQTWRVFNMLKQHAAVLYQSVTGSGKGAVMNYIFNQCLKNDKKVWFLVSGRLVLDTFCEELQENGDIPHARFQAGMHYDDTHDAVVCSVDTLQSRYFAANARMSKDDLDIPDYLLVDECRKIVSPKKQEILNWYKEKGTKIIGFDATPKAKGLKDIYDVMEQGESTPWHIRNGDLVPIVHYAPNARDSAFIKEVKEMRVSAGEYNAKDLDALAQNTVLIGNVVDQYEKITMAEYGERKSFVVACTNRAHAKAVQSAFLEAGITTEYIDGLTPQEERDDIKRRTESGEVMGIVSVLVLIYGANLKYLHIAILARPVKSVTVYLQFGGRVLRTYPDKKHAVLIDMADAVREIGYVDDVYTWNLEDEEFANETRDEREKDTAVEHVDITCSGCGHVYMNAAVCPKCGTKNIIAYDEASIVYYNKELIRQEKEMLAAKTQYEVEIDWKGQLKDYLMRDTSLNDFEKSVKFNKAIRSKFKHTMSVHDIAEIKPVPHTEDIGKYFTFMNLRSIHGARKRKRNQEKYK